MRGISSFHIHFQLSVLQHSTLNTAQLWQCSQYTD